jgi:PAS domain S-box-containing protein
MQKREANIQSRLLGLLLVVFIPILLIQAFIGCDVVRTRKMEEFQSNLELARAVGDTFNSFVRDVLRQELAIGIAVTAEPPISPVDFRRLLMESLQDNPAVAEWAWSTPEGNILWSTGTHIDQLYSNRNSFKKIISGQEWAVSNLASLGQPEEPVFAISRGIRDRSGKLLGVMVAVIRPEDLNETLTFNRSKDAGVGIIDSKGMMVFRRPQALAGWEDRQWGEMYACVRKALSGKEATEVIELPGGERRMVANVPIRSIGWVAGAGENEREVMKDIVSALAGQSALFLCVLLASFVVAFRISRSIGGPIKRIHDYAVVLGNGDWDARVSVDGPAEVQELAQALNRMASDLNRMETDLRASEERHRLLLSLMPAAVYTCDADGMITYFNRRAVEIWGLEPALEDSSVKFCGAFRLHSPDGRPMSHDATPMSDAIRSGKVTRDGEVVMERPDGSMVNVSVNIVPLRDGAGNIVGAINVFVDITERKRAEETLRRYELLAAHSRDIILFIRREDGRILEANTAAEAAYGYGREHLLELTIFDLRAPGTLADAPLQMLDADAGGILFETVHRRRDGVSFPVEVSSRGAVIGGVQTLISVARDITERRLAEEELRRNREWLCVTLGSIGDAVMTTDTDGRITYLNPMAEELTGWREEDVLGRPVGDVFRVIGQTACEAGGNIVDCVLRGEEILDLAGGASLIARDGSVIPIEDSAAPIKDDSGGIVGVVIVFYNVAEKRRAQEALRLSEERYRTLVEVSPDAILMNREGRVAFANPSALRLFGASTPEKLVGKSIFEVYHPDSHAIILDRAKRLLRGESVPLVEEKVLRVDDGAVVDVEAAACTFVEREGPVFQVILRDVTERKSAEDALRRSEARFKLLYETAGRLLVTQEPRRAVSELCRRVMEHLGCDIFLNFLVERDGPRLVLNAYAGLSEEESQRLARLEFGSGVCGEAAQKGECIVVEDVQNVSGENVSLLRDYGIQAYVCQPLIAYGAAIGALGFGTRGRARFSPEDLALTGTVSDQVAMAVERIRLIAELRQSRDELEIRVRERTAELGLTNRALREYAGRLERLNRELEEFAWIASHDLQEPLRKIQTFGSRLARASALGENEKDDLLRMIHASHRMASLIRSLKNYSEATRATDDFALVDLTDVVEEAVRDLKPLVQSAQALVEVEPLPSVETNRGKMLRLFRNLIRNSIQYARESEKPVVRITGEVVGDACRISVKDNGIGFDEQFMYKIFAPFQRLHGQNSPYEGTGMGLAICRKIVEMHGGAITARSAPGEGAEFIVVLPLRRGTPSSVAP